MGLPPLLRVPVSPDRHDLLQRYVRLAVGKAGLSVLLGTDTAVATEIAARMFDRSPDTLVAGDIDDAMGELANMLAGKVCESQLEMSDVGLPEHWTTSSIERLWRNTSVVAEAWCVSDQHLIYLAVLQDRGPDRPSEEI